MEKFQNKYRISSHRMPNWDYSGNGMYFITLVTQHRECNLGEIVNGEMYLSDFGMIVNNEWIKSFEMRQELFCDEYTIMPNHLHAIVVLDKSNVAVDPNDDPHVDPNVETHGRVSLRADQQNQPSTPNKLFRKPQSISSFVAGFKSAVNSKIDDYIDDNGLNIPKYNRNNHFFQPNYHDHVIRNQAEHQRIKNYIINNPDKWGDDKFNFNNKPCVPMQKSSIDEIRQRFDNDVERFSNLDTGQLSIIDAKISLELITEAAKRIVPNAKTLLDIGCGAGNYTLMMLSKIPDLNCTLVDLSKQMLDKAYERVSEQTSGEVIVLQGDIREVALTENHFDIILAGAVLHHLRDDNDWKNTFQKIFKLLRPGGCFMISDLIAQDTEALNDYTWERYGAYLESIGGGEYRQKVLDYVAKEDSPRSMNFQLDLMKSIGFSRVEILHKNMCFGAFGGIK